MDGETYAGRIGLDRIHHPDILPRLTEGVSSLAYARERADRQELRFIQLSNATGALQAAAEDVVRIARHDTVGTLDTGTALKYIDEMDAVIREAIHRINVQ